jgi:acetyl esterase/lipase
MSSHAGVDFAGAGHHQQQLDVFAACGDVDQRTAVLVLHGGAWRHGDRSMVHPRCQRLAAQGFTAVAAGYRLLGTAPWPAQLHDVKAAIRWIRKHADSLGIDGAQIAVQGHSAGAHLALMAAGTADRGDLDAPGEADTGISCSIAAVAAFYPAAALAVEPDDTSVPAAPLLGHGVTAEQARAVSPMQYIAGNFPPTVILHGTADRFIPAASSMRLYERLQASGVPAELHLVAGQDHEFDMTPGFAEVASMTVGLFLRAQVSDADAVRREVADFNPLSSMPPPH